MKRPLVALLTAVFAAVAINGPAGASADDQARAQAAIDQFSDRVVAAGFLSEGPADVAEGEDDEFAACLPGFGGVFGVESDELNPDGTAAVETEGVTARVVSDQFGYQDPSSATATTDPFSFGEPSEYATALVITVDDTYDGEVADFVDQLAADTTVACIRDALTEGMFGEAGPTETDPDEFGYDLKVEGFDDIGIGDRSAGLDIALVAGVPGVAGEVAITISLLAADVDRSIVVVLHGTSGTVKPVLDPEAELAATVESLTA